MRKGLLIALLAAAPPALAADPGTLSLEELLQSYDSVPPGQPEPEVRLEGWIERLADGRNEVVIVIEPEGETRLNAEPGITVTPSAGQALVWQVPLPHRHVDPTIDYFIPSAVVRMPFAGEPDQPIRVLVEFAYCVVDFQCFLGEEELSVAELND